MHQRHEAISYLSVSFTYDLRTDVYVTEKMVYDVCVVEAMHDMCLLACSRQCVLQSDQESN